MTRHRDLVSYSWTDRRRKRQLNKGLLDRHDAQMGTDAVTTTGGGECTLRIISISIHVHGRGLIASIVPILPLRLRAYHNEIRFIKQ